MRDVDAFRPLVDKTLADRSDLPPLAIGQRDAARLAGVSAKTLERLAFAGHPVGGIKVGGRILFHRETLAKWLAQQAEQQAGGTT